MDLRPGGWSPPGARGGAATLRVALYSHDTVGLGHLRRNIAIASSIVDAEAAEGRQTDVLLLSGARETASFPLPPGVDCLTLPALAKGTDGYAARHLRVPLGEVLDLRSALLWAALDRFDPDVLVVDKVAWGVCRELEPSIEHLRARGRARLVLGMRDVLDAPAVTAAEWAQDQTLDAIARLYDAVWWYGDPAVLDPVAEYDLPPEVARRLRPTGYLGHGRPAARADGGAAGRVPAPRGPYVLCMVGGGQDGAALARAFAEADLPPGHRGVLLTGPYLPQAEHDELAAIVDARAVTDVVRFTSEVARLVEGASAVVSMGGYNTVCEVLAAGSPALVVPRVHPRTEQLIRAERLADLGVLDVLHPDDLTPAALTRWLRDAVPGRGRGGAREDDRGRDGAHPVDLHGLARLPYLLTELLTGSPRAAHDTEEIHHGA